MKIFLTEVEEDGKRYAGPNILAEDWKKAEQAAKFNNLILVGEFQVIINLSVLQSIQLSLM